jgi:hypothetical protein
MENKKSNIVLFPASLDFYEKQLTSLIDQERYEEAYELCNWFMDISHLPPLYVKKIEALHTWLSMLLPKNEWGDNWQSREDETVDEAQDEQQLWLESVRTKSRNKPEYTSQLLTDLHQGSMEKQIIALEQLAYMQDEGIAIAICHWLEQEARHPFLQFRALQSLKLQNQLGKISLPREQGSLSVMIEHTPLRIEQFPSNILLVLSLLQDRGEVEQLDFIEFATQTWHEFLIFHYGTLFYRSLTEMNVKSAAIWASALQVVIADQFLQDRDRIEILARYEIGQQQIADWQTAYSILLKFIQLPLK